jgi:hypothetical protein
MRICYVTLKGTWHRTNTDVTDVFFYRRIMRERLRYRGGQFEATKVKAWSDHTIGRVAGKFEVTVPLRVGYTRPDKVARKVFEALMIGAMCRPPVIQVLDWYWDVTIQGPNDPDPIL